MFKQMFIVLISFYTFLSANTLSELFASPTQSEKDSVLAHWKSRDVGVYNWTVEDSGTLQGFRVDVVSHKVNSLRHYALVRYPLNYSTTENYQLLIVNHGGMGGVDDNILKGFSKAQYEENIVLVPSFQGEELRTPTLALGTFTSEGETSEFDYDIDDVLALINGAVENVTGASEENMLITGGSRGGCVTYLVAIREPRIRKAVVNYGGTDHLTFPNIEEIVSPMIQEFTNKGPFISSIYKVASKYMNNEMSLEEARFTLLSKSPIHFINLFPDYLQFHHGDQDGAVSVENSRSLDSVLIKSPVEGNYEYFEYPGGGHGSNMSGSSQRRDAFFAEPMLVSNNDTKFPFLNQNTFQFRDGFLSIVGVGAESLVWIADSKGVVLNSKKIQISSRKLNVSDFGAGVYFLRMKIKGETQSFSFTVK
ncbi:prolyl oligopeptidase family serine peptidase [Fibrobacterales bacterium]|nr:prolyl oligopeptidase family serine peptidase [Fibrobacterales bacterium]